ncbi:MAG TPA: sodium:glutamate symporter [Gammaproteobacteria bacterium]|nr:sodium:glutamate symporter [Gammaproteobacteria bacterium]
MEDSFHGVIAFAFMVSMILVGTLLRSKFSIFQRALIPASLLGGVIGFVAISLDLSLGFTNDDFVVFAFHFFTLSFMSLVLTGKEPGSTERSIQPGGLWMSIGWTMSLVLQALAGLFVIVLYNAATDDELSTFLGMLVTHGFTQGPGQAIALGSIWEADFQIEDAVNFGLIYASLGFVVSFLIGVPAARYAIRKGLNKNTAARLTDEFVRGTHDLARRPITGRQVTHSANVDSLVFHISILGLAYLLTHHYLLYMQTVTDGVMFIGRPVGVYFSHNLFFVHGLIICIIIRGLMNRFGYGDYIDNETQKRITGSSVDLMIVATLMGIQFSLLATYLLPILLVCLTVAFATAMLCFLSGRWLSTVPVERAITLFGCCTGSTGSGLLLLRILDPDLTTIVSRELAYFNVAVLLVSLHILWMMAPVLPTFGILTICLVYGGTFLVGGVLLRLLAPRT